MAGFYRKLILALSAASIIISIFGCSTSLAQSHIGISSNLFLESANDGGDISYEGVSSYSLRYARSNMFAEIRFNQYNFSDNPRTKDPDSVTYDASNDTYQIVRPLYESISDPNQFEVTYLSFIIGPRFELLDHIAYELGSSIDLLLFSNNTYGTFDNNPYLLEPPGRIKPRFPEANISFYSRIQAWYDITSQWRLSATWEFNTPIETTFLPSAGYGSNEGQSVYIEEVTFYHKFYLNFMVEYRID